MSENPAFHKSLVFRRVIAVVHNFLQKKHPTGRESIKVYSYVWTPILEHARISPKS